VVWVAIAILMLIPFLRGHLRFSAVCAAVLLSFLATSFDINQHDLYSPYQILTVADAKDPYPSVMVNHMYYQKIMDLRPAAVAADPTLVDASQYYAMPYLMKPQPADELIVGSGTGNDVASAIRHGAGHVDAVEIDPAILSLGRLMHPESPYDSARVTAHVQDARAFIRYTPEKYDLIVYGLLDSHTLLSGLSGVRLDSYIYTVEAIREARAHLKPGGVISLSFCMISPEFGRKLYLMIQQAFDGKAPLVYFPNYDGGYTFFIGENLSPIPTAALPAGIYQTDYFAGNQLHADVSTDDWPFFYMPARRYPVSYVVLIVILWAVAGTFIRPMFAESGGGFSAPCFFLGAGFMLLETKAITELALYYGSTWVVIGVVIAAILTLAFLANLLLIGIGRFPSTAAYAMLLVSLALSLLVSGSKIPASASAWSGPTLVTALLTLPLFFAGLAFSSELTRANSIGIALGSNLIGAMLGGCLEYNAMYFGYRSLYYLAVALYALAFAASLNRRRRTPSTQMRASTK
jgi:spermidine synthase